MPLRDKQILEFWDRSKELRLANQKYKKFLRYFFGLLLANDAAGNDITTNSAVDKNKKISAAVVAKEDGIFAGAEEFLFLNRGLNVKFLKKDGSMIKNGDKLVSISGNAKKILSRERISLNVLQRMSGIATLTCRLSEKSGKARIAATRKTLWGLLDKKAVSIGNGLTHRLSLNDGILIKDNHLKVLGYDFEKALNSAKGKSEHIEIEVESKKQALSAAKTIKRLIKKNDKTLYAIMLDNISPEKIKSIIKGLKNLNLCDCILLEASGNISAENLAGYANCGVDIISMGGITHSAKILNMSLEIE
ncbi:carboxylating nicotinate-nucleotide diphosphorylase [Candidatus Woesearchaeota archaeon]|nr:carboxylating nicotinate-nucleotide diphosphorylase [Candidatus Woesearchaeota archaeon]